MSSGDALFITSFNNCQFRMSLASAIVLIVLLLCYDLGWLSCTQIGTYFSARWILIFAGVLVLTTPIGDVFENLFDQGMRLVIDNVNQEDKVRDRQGRFKK